MLDPTQISQKVDPLLSLVRARARARAVRQLC
jgi:hypothetical protein